ncbi:MAG: hypothetical protein AB1724_13705 [Thermodesulfobacteriota bacterium]
MNTTISPMIIYNDIFSWEGLSRKFGLAIGKIRLRIFDLGADGPADNVLYLRPIIIVVSDVPGEKISVKGWAGPLASCIIRKFNIDYQRMMWLEYYPAVEYGQRKTKYIQEKIEVVEFVWEAGHAVRPRWRPLDPPLLDRVRELVHKT